MKAEATALKRDIWKRDVSKRDNLKCSVCHVESIKGYIKLVFNALPTFNFVIKEFNLTYEVQNMANGTFQIVPFGNVQFPNVPFECSCLWAKWDKTTHVQSYKVDTSPKCAGNLFEKDGCS